MMRRMPRIGVVGAGYWGANLVRNCHQMGVLAAVCDADLRPLNEVRSKYPGVGLFCDLDQMIEHSKLDAVVLAAPAPAHASLALRRLAAGKHVFVEKPLALNVEDAERVVEAAEAAGLTLFVGHVLLYHPAIRAMFDAINQGKIGRVRHLRSRRLRLGPLALAGKRLVEFRPARLRPNDRNHERLAGERDRLAQCIRAPGLG